MEMGLPDAVLLPVKLSDPTELQLSHFIVSLTLLNLNLIALESCVGCLLAASFAYWGAGWCFSLLRLLDSLEVCCFF